ncbi:MAG: hypothetical protein ACI4QD_08990 [Kiritimatiellia bacterium]
MKFKAFLLTLLLLPAAVLRASPELEAAAAAAVASESISSSKVMEDLKAIPGSALAVLYVPLGLVQTITSPITGNYRSGPRNLRVGLLAPVRFVVHTLSLPIHAVY